MDVTAPVETAPDFRHIDTWIFDLDNTLYPAHCDVFPQIDARMTLFIMRALHLTAVEAKGLQHAYYRQYGTTLAGLMAVHDVDPEGFLDFVHDVDVTAVLADPALRRGLARLPGRRLVFTNGSSEYAERVLKRLGVDDLMEDIWDIRKAGFVPKPKPEAYRRMMAAWQIEPARTAYFEDLARNLAPAYDLGLTTVWLSGGAPWGGLDPRDGVAPSGSGDPGFSSGPRAPINHQTGDLAGFLLSIGI